MGSEPMNPRDKYATDAEVTFSDVCTEHKSPPKYNGQER
jgi:hypothetical protein